MVNAFLVVLPERETKLQTERNYGQRQRDSHRRFSHRAAYTGRTHAARADHHLVVAADRLHPREPLQNHAPQMDLHRYTFQNLRRPRLRFLQSLLRLAQLNKRSCEPNGQSIATIFPKYCNG